MKSLPVVALAAALCACGSSQSTSAPLASGGSSGSVAIAQDFTGRDIAGKTFLLSDHLGKEVVLLDFWSTFCEPCKAEFPHLRAMYDAQRAKGLLVVGIAMDGPETVADVPSFVKRFELDFPVVTDEDSRISGLYNPKKSMPYSVLIDRGGRVVAMREGYTPGDEKALAADVARALGDTSSAPAP
jgi:peroxiredoxin